jgi:hypothetical protein
MMKDRDYPEIGSAYQPRNGSFRAVDELRLGRFKKRLALNKDNVDSSG